MRDFLIQGSANFFWKGPESKYLKLVGHKVSVTTQLCNIKTTTNKSLFTKTDSRFFVWPLDSTVLTLNLVQTFLKMRKTDPEGLSFQRS